MAGERQERRQGKLSGEKIYSRLARWGEIGAAAALSVGLISGCTASQEQRPEISTGSSEEEPSPTSSTEPTPDTPELPSLPPDEKIYEKLTDEHSLSYDKLDTPSKLAKARYEVENAWIDESRGLSACTDTFSAYDPFNDTPIADMIDASGCLVKTNDAYSEALYGPDWADNPRVADVIEAQREAYTQSVSMKFFTIGQQRRFNSEYHVTKTSPLTMMDEAVTLETQFEGTDNFYETGLPHVQEATEYDRIGGTTGRLVENYVRDGGRWIVDRAELTTGE